MTRSGSGLIAFRLSPDLDARLRAAASQNMSDFVRDAIEQKLASEAPPAPAGSTPRVKRTVRPASSGGRCEHSMKSGSFCRRCDGLVP